MTTIPGYVRARLAVEPAGPHPDPDQLAAFAERALGERERLLVLAHAAVCAECRQVLALALPEVDAAAVVPRAVRRRWLAPSLKWASMLAGLTAVGVVALMVLPGRHHSSSVYLAKSANVTSAPARGLSGGAAESDQNTIAANRNESRNQPAAAKKATKGAPSAFASSGAMARLTLPAPGAPAPEAKERPNAIATTADMVAAPSSTPPSASPLADAQSPGERMIAGAMARRETANVAPAELQKDLDVKHRVAPVRWKLSPAGALLRSTDGGDTWMSARVDSPTTFRALSVFASHVWAGGADGKVYHSPDSGAHWEALPLLGADGVAPAGEITGLEFTDALHGRAAFSAGQVWTTADGGRTWTRPTP